MKKILITGGAGFIGYHLTKALCKKNHVTILDNFSRGKMDKHLREIKLKKNVEIISKDLNKKINLKKKFDFIFHLAATVGVKNVIKKPVFTLENNILPYYCNWIPNPGNTKIDLTTGKFVEGFLPHHEIGIMHLAGGYKVDNKDMRFDKNITTSVETIDGKFVNKSFRFST